MTPTAPGRRLRAIAAVLLATVCLICMACGGNDDPVNSDMASDRPDLATTPATSTPTDEPEENPMRIMLTIDGQELTGTLDDTPITQAFIEQLPLTLPLEDFHGSERIAYLPDRLDTSEAPSAGGEVAAGDIAYYSPWGNLALFYRAGASYAGGLIQLGQLDDGAAEHLATLDDNTTVTIAGS